MKLNYFIARGNKFVSGGISKRHGPYVGGVYRKGKLKLKGSAGGEGIKASASWKIARHTEVGIEHSLRPGRHSLRPGTTRLFIKSKKRRFVF